MLGTDPKTPVKKVPREETGLRGWRRSESWDLWPRVLNLCAARSANNIGDYGDVDDGCGEEQPEQHQQIAQSEERGASFRLNGPPAAATREAMSPGRRFSGGHQ